VQSVLLKLPELCLEVVEPVQEFFNLRDAYLAAGIVGPKSTLDAEHIAAASIAGADLIVSWNFKHRVHFDKIRGYHSVNLIKGYGMIPIHSPREVVSND
jgi:2-keto-3-deoxy-6-phosphogluconate aldolase